MAPPKKKKQKGPEETEIDMTPMIDIVFQLLIFFIVCTKIKKDEGSLTAYLPTDEGSAAAPPPPEQEFQEVNIGLKKIPNKAKGGESLVDNGNDTVSRYYWNNEDVGYARTGLRELVTRLKSKDKEKDKIIINPDEESALWDVIQVLNICRVMAFKKVTFKNKASKGPSDSKK
jgi:biopolymer transport protein ExbD